eukprot:TRINITY_DN5587_c0_g1_i27.p1 TRINITY_DN5587_c0_g1~~TRINITY_DN5587_c0_g1_i27.p1  ORF type:complete len:287 (+),score=11.79 TRINITY_DN5587_c0_g1_i27:60-920(+)
MKVLLLTLTFLVSAEACLEVTNESWKFTAGKDLLLPNSTFQMCKQNLLNSEGFLGFSFQEDTLECRLFRTLFPAWQPCQNCSGMKFSRVPQWCVQPDQYMDDFEICWLMTGLCKDLQKELYGSVVRDTYERDAQFTSSKIVSREMLFKGRVYQFNRLKSGELNWNQAKADCEESEFGGFLASIPSYQAFDFLRKHIIELKMLSEDHKWSGVFFGGQVYREHSHTFVRWVDNTPMFWPIPWGPGEPNNKRHDKKDGTETALELWIDGFNDIPPTHSGRISWVCSKDA